MSNHAARAALLSALKMSPLEYNPVGGNVWCFRRGRRRRWFGNEVVRRAIDDGLARRVGNLLIFAGAEAPGIVSDVAALEEA